jgi:hypothetical protein
VRHQVDVDAAGGYVGHNQCTILGAKRCQRLLALRLALLPWMAATPIPASLRWWATRSARVWCA